MYRDIEIFRLVMQAGSTSRAAEKLGISQPAVSQAIKRLETAAGLKLFDRIRGKLEPKREALLLIEEVDQFFIGLERIEHRIKSLHQLGERSLHIASYPALGNQFIPRAISRFLRYGRFIGRQILLGFRRVPHNLRGFFRHDRLRGKTRRRLRGLPREFLEVVEGILR